LLKIPEPVANAAADKFYRGKIFWLLTQKSLLIQQVMGL
jgi:hypothetical protein